MIFAVCELGFFLGYEKIIREYSRISGIRGNSTLYSVINLSFKKKCRGGIIEETRGRVEGVEGVEGDNFQDTSYFPTLTRFTCRAQNYFFIKY